ncbi:peptidyl-prolyl cis-trans isomerase [Caulobacter sp. CCG-8]|uniref:peptidylprolyl isomerase n=1 Tax=Caulobacter sp. CCG-8 TaxID=3127958 RepID=UPI00307EA9DA
MLAGFRSFAKSPFAVVLFGLLIVSFAVFGISDVFRHPPGKWVIAAGSRNMSPEDFKAQFENFRKREQAQGQTITPDIAVQQGVDRKMLTQLALQESLAELLHKMGVRASDKLVADTLREQLAALPPGQRPFDPITGKFDNQLYQRLLAQNDLTPARFEASLRDDIAQTHTFSAVAAGLRAPRLYSALQAAYALEGRDLAAFAINPATVEKPGAPTDAQLQAFMKEHAAQLTRPETRVLSVARFSAKALEATVTVPEAEIVKTYNFRKDTLGTAETRSFVQIQAPDAKAAATIVQRLTKGDAPAAIASAYGKQPLVIDSKPKTALPDRKVADAVFALAAGQVSAPIAGEFGLSVVKLVKINPATTPSLESQRPAIEAELKAQAAQAKAYEQTQAYQDAHDGGANLIDAATKAGAFVRTTAPVAATGVDQGGQPDPALTPDALKTAFELPAGGESELIEAGKGEYFAVRVEKVIPSAMPPLAEVRAPLAQQWQLDQLFQRMKAKADALSERVKKGESLEAVAAASQTQVQRVPNITRQNARQFQGLGRDLLISTFGAKPGQPFVARGPQGGYLVAMVEKIHSGSPEQMAQITEAMRPQVSQGLFRAIGQSAQDAAKTELKTKVNLTLARQAIGVDTSALPSEDGKTPAKKEKAPKGLAQ